MTSVFTCVTVLELNLSLFAFIFGFDKRVSGNLIPRPARTVLVGALCNSTWSDLSCALARLLTKTSQVQKLFCNNLEEKMEACSPFTQLSLC